MLERKVKQFIKKHSLVDDGDRLLVACSGGSDSTALLTVLAGLYNSVAAVYVNHQLRGSESEEEENFVRNFCNRKKIPLFVEKIHWKKRPADLEQSARKRRYRHFEKVAREHGFQKIALAHHKDDSVETFLLNLIRGSGPAGLAGIPPKRDPYIRPLLDCTRKEIRAYLKKHKIPFFTDSSNVNRDFRRNKIRHDLIPMIEKHLNPEFSTAVHRASSWIAEQNRLLQKLMQPYNTLLKKESSHSWSLSYSDWLKMDPPLMKSFLKMILPEMDPQLRLNSRSIHNLIRSIQDGRVTAELPGILEVRRVGKEILFRIKKERIGVSEVDVPGPGEYRFTPGRVILDFSIQPGSDFNPKPHIAYLDAALASFPLYIRNWKKGDSFRPLGMKGHKKLSDFWIDSKIPRSARKLIPLVYKDDDLIWTAGYQISHDYRVTDKTKKLLRIEVKKDA